MRDSHAPPNFCGRCGSSWCNDATTVYCTMCGWRASSAPAAPVAVDKRYQHQQLAQPKNVSPSPTPPPPAYRVPPPPTPAQSHPWDLPQQPMRKEVHTDPLQNHRVFPGAGQQHGSSHGGYERGGLRPGSVVRGGGGGGGVRMPQHAPVAPWEVTEIHSPSRRRCLLPLQERPHEGEGGRVWQLQ